MHLNRATVLARHFGLLLGLAVQPVADLTNGVLIAFQSLGNHGIGNAAKDILVLVLAYSLPQRVLPGTVFVCVVVPKRF